VDVEGACSSAAGDERRESMRYALLFTVALLLSVRSIKSQSGHAPALSIKKEPHHSLVFENEHVRVFHLALQPNEATKPHRHPSFYAYLSLRPVTISNEVAGRSPVITHLEAGEVRTSKGGFEVAERNTSTDVADIFVVEPTKEVGDGFATPLAIPMHDAGIVELYTGATMRVYTLAIAATGRAEEHTEQYDSLVLALSDAAIREVIPGQEPTDWNMKSGDTRWVPRGTTHSETNVGSNPTALEVFEFN
jgi:quercetin dioxygenase-like cupin family protein